MNERAWRSCDCMTFRFLTSSIFEACRSLNGHTIGYFDYGIPRPYFWVWFETQQ
jgi:hypothetical protein